MKVLVGCEESQRVTIALRSRGVEAYSCDLLPCSGSRKDWHIQDNLLDVINRERWGGLIVFPPCTYLTVTQNRHMRCNPDRWAKMIDAATFALTLYNYDCDFFCMENPVGYLSTFIGKPSQIVQPYQFGDNYSKKTCLWLKGLPLLTSTNIVEPAYVYCKAKNKKSGRSKYSVFGTMSSSRNPEVARLRSQTPVGLAEAMADQWSKYLI